jgi:hypothetical protein
MLVHSSVGCQEVALLRGSGEVALGSRTSSGYNDHVRAGGSLWLPLVPRRGKSGPGMGCASIAMFGSVHSRGVFVFAEGCSFLAKVGWRA